MIDWTKAEKVAIFVVRADELLVFHHERSGIQVPAGTVEPGEDPQSAAVRELWEESGLGGLDLEPLGHLEERLDVDGWGFVGIRTRLDADGEWVEPGWVRLLDRHGGQALIDAGEFDADIEPPRMLTSRRGWIGAGHLLGSWRRHFYAAPAPDRTPEAWSVWADDGGGSEFRFFWMKRSDASRRLVALQRPWLRVLEKGTAGASREDGD
jgi:8-oxo-dGTP pyrophosphatase MutT (NUDIX family)